MIGPVSSGADSDTRGSSIDYMQPIPGSEQSNLGAYLAAPEPITDTYSSNAVHSGIGQPITQEAALQAAEMGDYATVLDFASQNSSQYNFDSIAAMPDKRGYFERIGSELRGSVVVDQPLSERIKNAGAAAYYGDTNTNTDGIESSVLFTEGFLEQLGDGLQELAQDPFSIIRDPLTLGYDQIETAFYYGTDGFLGDPNSVARNQERGESLLNLADAAEASASDSKKAGYLFGGALLGLKKGRLPDAPNSGPANVRIRTGEAGELQSAFAKIDPGNIGQGTYTNASSRALARRLGNATDDAGHAVGQNLGGLGGTRSGNIFPQAPSVNRGAFNQFEQQIVRRVEAGDEVFVRVAPRYESGSTRPYEILYQARINGETISRTFANP